MIRFSRLCSVISVGSLFRRFSYGGLFNIVSYGFFGSGLVSCAIFFILKVISLLIFVRRALVRVR